MKHNDLDHFGVVVPDSEAALKVGRDRRVRRNDFIRVFSTWLLAATFGLGGVHMQAAVPFVPRPAVTAVMKKAAHAVIENVTCEGFEGRIPPVIGTEDKATEKPQILPQTGTARAEPQFLHFKPGDHVLGDVHPFFHEGECFLYYLKPEKFDHTVGLARSKDLLKWREAPVTHARGPVKRPARQDDWTAPWFVLGVLRDPVGGIFRSFYGVGQGRMVSSESRDLLNWDCASKEYSAPPGDYYKQRRDPYVFWIPEMKKYGCVMTTWMKDSSSRMKGGAISLATSPDLKNWTDHGAVIYPGDMGPPECPQMFTLGGRWYALASIWGPENGVGRPTYWTSNSPLGPWAKKPTGVLDGRHNCAAQIAFDGDIPLLFGWIPMTPTWQGKEKSWGGHLAIPREIYSLPDGSLGTRLPERLLKRLAKLPWREIPDFPITPDLRPFSGAGMEEWHGIAAEFTLQMPMATKAVRVGIAPLGEIVVEHARLRILDAIGEAGSEIEADIPADRAVPVRVFVEADMVEAFVNDRFSLAARLPTRQGPWHVTMRSEGIGASVRAACISALKWADP